MNDVYAAARAAAKAPRVTTAKSKPTVYDVALRGAKMPRKTRKSSKVATKRSSKANPRYGSAFKTAAASTVGLAEKLEMSGLLCDVILTPGTAKVARYAKEAERFNKWSLGAGIYRPLPVEVAQTYATVLERALHAIKGCESVKVRTTLRSHQPVAGIYGANG